MSETFYIKNTAFDDIGVGSPPAVDIGLSDLTSFIIGPGELNGPAGLNRDSDLELYGFGALKWGEGVNQNQYRQLENFACPQKENGDYWAAAGSPPVYDSGIHPIAPKDENDLGIGNGITTPLIGQSWYNTTDKTLYAFGAGSPAAEWRSDMTATNTLDMDGFGLINVLDPTDAPTTLPGSILTPQDAVTVGWADLRFVNVTGDTMTGILNMGGNRLENIASPSSDADAINRGYADTRYVNVAGDFMTDILDMNGNRITNLAAAGTALDAMSRDSSDSRYVGKELSSEVNFLGGNLVRIYNDAGDSGSALQGVGLEMYQKTSGADAFMSFNETGSGFNFGRDGSTNDLFVGGGSFGGTKYKVWHAGNDGAGSGLDADRLDGYSSSSFIRTGEGYEKSSINSPSYIFSRSFAPNSSGTKTDTLTYSGKPSWASYVLLRFNFTAFNGNIHDLRWARSFLGGYMVIGAGADDTDQGNVSAPHVVSEVWVPTWARTLTTSVLYGGTASNYYKLTVYKVGWHQ